MAASPEIAAQVATLLARPYARFFGIQAVDISPGAVTLALAHRPEFEHAPGFFQGSITTALAELAASWSAATAVREDAMHLVLEQSIRFVGPARGERLIAVGRTIRSGRSISVAGADVFAEQDGRRELCALLSLTMRHARQTAQAAA